MSEESDDRERMKNLVLFKMYLTDQEMQDVGPGVIIILLVLAALMITIGVAIK